MTITKASNKSEKLKCFLKNSVFFSQQLFEEHQEGYYALDIDGRFIQVNKECEKLTGYSKLELTNLFYGDLLTKDSKELVNNSFAKTLRGDIQNYRCTLVMKDKMKLEVSVTNTPIIVDNEVLGIYGCVRDITKNKEQKRKLPESERLHRSLVEHSPDAIVVIKDNYIVYSNLSAAILFGFSKGIDLIGKKVFQLFPTTNMASILSSLKRDVECHPSALVEEKVFCEGKEIDVEVKAVPTVFEESPAVYLIIRDITERKLAHEFMVNSEKLSVAGQLAAGIAHEIRNPITAIKGFFQLMERGGYKKEFFPVITAEINRIELILSELLALARPQLEKYQQKNIRNVLQHVVALTSSHAILHNIQITTSIKEKHLIVLCDENKLKQVFINFIKNAIEAMPNGGTITVRAISEGEGSVIIQIIDEGTGIPQNLLSEIGKPFFTTKENGTGLGLMVSYEIINHHNGEVKIESNSNGTTISVILPISK